MDNLLESYRIVILIIGSFLGLGSIISLVFDYFYGSEDPYDNIIQSEINKIKSNRITWDKLSDIDFISSDGDVLYTSDNSNRVTLNGVIILHEKVSELINEIKNQVSSNHEIF